MPLQLQIVGQYQEAIMTGQLRAGDKLPTLDEQMRDLGVSRETCAIAYRLLSERGFVEGRAKFGTFVIEPPAEAVIAWAATVMSPAIRRLMSVGLDANHIKEAFQSSMERWFQGRGPQRRRSTKTTTSDRRRVKERRGTVASTAARQRTA